jgi:hypothetical protein
MTGWFARRKVWLAIIVPYLALSISVVAVIGVYTTRADQAEVRAALASERASRALELQQASCHDRQTARADNDEILYLIAASLPVPRGDALRALINARPPVICP